MSPMRKIVGPALVMILSATTGIAFDRSSDPFLRPPPSERCFSPDGYAEQKAHQLYLLLRKENPRLVWDDCLAKKALVRAKQLVSGGYFGHRDPATGKNPAWDMVGTCFEFRVAGENLVKGRESPQFLHMTLMSSPAHRENIMDPGYELVGVGCWDQVCVELFAGF